LNIKGGGIGHRHLTTSRKPAFQKGAKAKTAVAPVGGFPHAIIDDSPHGRVTAHLAGAARDYAAPHELPDRPAAGGDALFAVAVEVCLPGLRTTGLAAHPRTTRRTRGRHDRSA
jgi:hypothetical protein